MSHTSAIRLAHATKYYDRGVPGVDNISLSVQHRRLMVLLGASGCGKTSTLRLIAGLERPDCGEVWLNGQCVAGDGVWVEPEKRNVSMVFQDYALFPHMSVEANIAFALKSFPRRARRARVQEVLALVGLPEMGGRFPHQLSGGQQQRVALARALAPKPEVILLDEPFSNLDAALRRSTREEVVRILKHSGATTVFVTHDQDEALAIADDIAMLSEGRLLQVGSPQDLYHKPASKEVAAFVGEANFVRAVAAGTRADSPLGNLRLTHSHSGAVDVLVRPESIHLTPEIGSAHRVKAVQFLGFDKVVTIQGDGFGPLRARLRAHVELAIGAEVRIDINEALVAFPV
ncbi:MAG: ABC transporter ATP-binding protein [Chloroflexi bacterium]|nr:ABC transporter ATP-binding protein [Chloroflexota bacterium]